MRLYYELLSLVAFVFPVGNIVGPLVLWMVKKDGDPQADADGKQVINFNISWLLWSIVSCGLGALVWLVIVIIAILKASGEKPFKHPLTIRFLK